MKVSRQLWGVYAFNLANVAQPVALRKEAEDFIGVDGFVLAEARHLDALDRILADVERRRPRLQEVANGLVVHLEHGDGDLEFICPSFIRSR